MTKWKRVTFSISLLLALSPLLVQAQDTSEDRTESTTAEESSSNSDKKPAADAERYDRPTEFGVRFTPAIAEAITSRMTEQMQERYELKDEQVAKIRDAVKRNMMALAHENSEMGQDLVETMMASMISNEGSFKKDDAVEFGEKMSPFIPKLREFFTKSSGDIGRVMTLKQRLRYTADMTALTAGLTMFEKRMNNWRDGEVTEGANPFFDARGSNEEEDENADPNETKEMRRARRGVERSLRWQINYEQEWDRYVTNAAVYYDFDEEQQNAANGILDDCKKQAERIQTDDWWDRVKQNRIASRLNRTLDSKYSQGPVEFQLDQAFEKMKSPLENITMELKRRIEKMPTTRQRLQARRKVEKLMQEKGLKSLPL